MRKTTRRDAGDFGSRELHCSGRVRALACNRNPALTIMGLSWFRLA